MRILFINVVCGIRSTGRICTDLATSFEAQGNEVRIAYGRGEVPVEYQKYAHMVGSKLDVLMHAFKSRIFDSCGFSSVRATKKLLAWADEFNPEMIWLHNLHGYYINIELLFEWIKSRPNMEVKWTMHDCWSFTGHCTHFSYKKCDRWKTGCFMCPQKKCYPASFLFDCSKRNYDRKKNAFTGVKNMTIITPSLWLKKLINQSFLKDYHVVVVHNEIDTQVFRPTASDFKKKYGLQNCFVVLGVASKWDERKGLFDFYMLANKLSCNYRVVLVGLDAKQLKRLPCNILGLSRTNSKQELAEIYSAADVFVNLTYEDTYPTVNLEAKACGTPVITYSTGGSVESVERELVARQGDIDEIVDKICLLTSKNK